MFEPNGLSFYPIGSSLVVIIIKKLRSKVFSTEWERLTYASLYTV